MSDQHDDEAPRRPLTSAEMLARRKQEQQEREQREASASADAPADSGPRPASAANGSAPTSGGAPRPRPRPAGAAGSSAGTNPARTPNPAAAGAASRPRPNGDRPRRPRQPASGSTATVAAAAAGSVASRSALPAGPPTLGEDVLAGASVFLDPPPGTGPITAVELAQVAYDGNPRNWTRIRRRSGPAIRFLLVAGVLVLFGLFAMRAVGNWVDGQIHPGGGPGEEVTFTVEEGWTTNDIASELSDAVIVSNASIFRQYMNCPGALRWLLDCSSGGDYSFQAGQYVLNENMDYDAVIATLAAGPVVPDTGNLLLVTVREGLTLGQISDDLMGQLPAFSGDELVAGYVNPELRWALMPADQPLIEGLLFPETYAVDEEGEQDELGLLRRMREQFDSVVGELDIEARAAALGVTPYEAIIVASLVEEEAKIDADRAKIAQVIYNRLAAGWALGIDASTRYAVGKPPGEPLTVTDLASDSPYNTRNPNVIGLPPTPISAPGRASLEAALNPEPGPWMYYVLTDEGGVEGAHRFVETEAEFTEAVAVCRELGYCG